MLCLVMLCNVVWCYVMLCIIMLSYCYVISCYIILCYCYVLPSLSFPSFLSSLVFPCFLFFSVSPSLPLPSLSLFLRSRLVSLTHYLASTICTIPLPLSPPLPTCLCLPSYLVPRPPSPARHQPNAYRKSEQYWAKRNHNCSKISAEKHMISGVILHYYLSI